MGKFLKKLLATFAIVGVYSLPLAQEARSTIVGTTEADTDVTHLRLDTANDPLTNKLEIENTTDAAENEALHLKSLRATPTAGDCIRVNYSLNNDIPSEIIFAYYLYCADDIGDGKGTNHGGIKLFLRSGGALNQRIHYDEQNSNLDIDFNTVQGKIFRADDGASGGPGYSFSSSAAARASGMYWSPSQTRLEWSVDSNGGVTYDGVTFRISDDFSAFANIVLGDDTGDTATFGGDAVLVSLTNAQESQLATTEGNHYWNTDSKDMKCWDGSAWVDCVTNGATTNEEFFGWMTAVSFLGDHATSAASKSGFTQRNTFRIPTDFSSVITAELWVFPDFTNATADLDLDTDMSGSGEAFNFHSDTDTTATYNLTANQRFEIDISSVIDLASADDVVGLALTNNTSGGGSGTVHAVGIFLEYNVL